MNKKATIVYGSVVKHPLFRGLLAAFEERVPEWAALYEQKDYGGENPTKAVDASIAQFISKYLYQHSQQESFRELERIFYHAYNRAWTMVWERINNWLSKRIPDDFPAWPEVDSPVPPPLPSGASCSEQLEMNITIDRNGTRYGPYTLEEIKDYLGHGNVHGSDWAWYEGCADWMPVKEVLLLACTPAQSLPQQVPEPQRCTLSLPKTIRNLAPNNGVLRTNVRLLRKRLKSRSTYPAKLKEPIHASNTGIPWKVVWGWLGRALLILGGLIFLLFILLALFHSPSREVRSNSKD